jgi:XTP/dITP diphosphohydrolase
VIRIGPTLLVATTNAGKIKEILDILKLPGVSLKTLNDVPSMASPEETGTTFLQNAQLKAAYYARQYECACLAEDSGLEIDALEGRPGVYSARFMGEDTPYGVRNQHLLETLSDVPLEHRTARYHSAVVLHVPGYGEVHAEGTVEGRIARAARGHGGFGYDPIFWVDEHQATFGELSAEVKNAMSHRSRSLSALRQRLDTIG